MGGGEGWTGIPFNYDPAMTDDQIEQCRGANVTILDVSLPPDTLRRVLSIAFTVTLLDHHASAFDKYLAAGLIDPSGFERPLADVGSLRIRIDPSGRFSGVRMTWEHYYGKDAWDNPAVPHLLRAIEDHDLWRHRLPFTSAFLAVLAMGDLTVDAIQGMIDRPQADVLATGAAIQAYQRTLILRHAERAVEIETPLGWVAAVECTAPEIVSQLGNVLAQGRPYAIVWRSVPGTDTVALSLRSAEGGADVRAIAERNKGGGHLHAAGCTESASYWLYLIEYSRPIAKP